MKDIFHGRSLYVIIALIIIVPVIFMMSAIGGNGDEEIVTAIVDTGIVQQLVSVSGVAEADELAELAFPVTGIVKEVFVTEGSEVQAGDTLLSLTSADLAADRLDASADLARAIADRDELIAGPSESERFATGETVVSAEAALATTIENQERAVENARRALLSTGLSAFSDDDDEEAVPPTVSGTYTCDAEGTYTIDLFSSGAASGYSYRLSGLEFGTYVVSTEQAVALGDCGLRVQFDPNSKYNRSVFKIDIPNKKSSLYTTYLNAYTLAQTQAASSIALAEQEVSLAKANANNSNAPAREEAIRRANASIASAQARLARIDASLADRTLTAPFSGIITEIDILPGETVTTAPVVTLLAEADFEITARIPEIDIGKLLVGQKTNLVFDARSGEVLTGVIDFISLKATEIDGVAYYDALIELDSTPQWLRSGLNADIDVVIEETPDAVLRLPKRFVFQTADGYEVILQDGESYASTTVEVLMEGNDGYYAITGLSAGDTVVAP